MSHLRAAADVALFLIALLARKDPRVIALIIGSQK